MKKPLFPITCCLPVMLQLALCVGVRAQIGGGNYFTAPYGPGGTWNLYQAVAAPMTWVRAQELAQKLEDPLGGSGKKGHLVTIGSAAENQFVYKNVNGRFIWIGMTDNEKWGGKEAGTDRTGGWAWVTGEPVTFTAWQGSEPSSAGVNGEDAVVVGQSGRWSDWGIGTGGQQPDLQPFMIEWETQAKQPVKGAVVSSRMLPEKWPVDLATKGRVRKGSGEGGGGWKVYGSVGIDGQSLLTIAKDIARELQGEADDDIDPAVFQISQLNYRWPPRPEKAGGWVDITDKPPHKTTEGGCGALHVARVHLDKPATWSINIHADDYFAVRFPGLKWKSVTGMGGIDPLDPETLYYDAVCGDARAIGVIDLPAGDHTLEVLLGNRVSETMIQVLAAPGEFTMDGGTDQWRFPGHKAGGELPWPGVDAAAWTVTRTERAAGGEPLKKLADGLALAATSEGKTTEGVAKINFIDSNAAGDVFFPDPVDFPGDSPGGQDNYVIRATAKLVIPRDGLYQLGIQADGHCALRVIGHEWTRLIRNTGYTGAINGDALYSEAADMFGTNGQVVGEVPLTQGTYEIEALYVEMDGPSSLAIFGGPAGFAPRLIVKDGAGMEPDVDGLPLVLPKK